MKKDRFRSAASYAVLLVLGLLLGYASLSVHDQVVVSTSVDTTTCHQAPTTVQPLERTKASSGGSLPDSTYKPSSLPSGATSVFRLLDSDGRPIVGEVLTVANSLFPEADPLKVSTNDEGRAQFSLATGTPVTIFLPKGIYFLGPALAFLAHEADRKRDVITASEYELRVCVGIEILVDVSYSDGQKYGGTVYLQPDGANALLVELSEDSDTRIVSTESATVFTVAAKSRRPGFASYGAKLTPKAGRSTDDSLVLEVTLDYTDDARGNLIIDLSSFEPGAFYSYSASRVGETQRHISIGEKAIEGGKVHLSVLLEPGEYHLVLTNSQPAKEYFRHDIAIYGHRYSTTITVKARESTPVIPAVLPTGSAEFSILDENGKPIPYAVARYPHDSLVRWHLVKKYGSGMGRMGSSPLSISDSEGRVVLHGLEPIPQEIELCAEGYSTKRVSITPVSERTVSGGTVILTMASGSIVVKMIRTDGKESGRYSLAVLQTGGAVIIPRREFSGSEYQISGLQHGRYTISVKSLENEITSRAQNIELTADAPEAELVVTVKPRE